MGDSLPPSSPASVRQNPEILIQAFSFRSSTIAVALIEAHKRGVKVSVIIDKSDRSEGMTPGVEMSNAGLHVYVDGKHAAADNRVIIIDGKTVFTGSFNFSKMSEELNADNMLVIDSGDLAKQYRANWMKHREHSDPYLGGL